MMFMKIMLAVCILVGMVVIRELCPVSFLVVGECPSVLLWYVVMSYVNCGDDG